MGRRRSAPHRSLKITISSQDVAGATLTKRLTGDTCKSSPFERSTVLLVTCFINSIGDHHRAKYLKSAAKYQDPKTGATWSGRGRAPRWILNAKDRTKSLISGNASVASSAATRNAKPADNYIRGPQPARYRHPKSGATWSGRGPAPAWLASVKDRTKFLIGGAVATDFQPAIKKAVTKKASMDKKDRHPIRLLPGRTRAGRCRRRKRRRKKAEDLDRG